MESRQRRSKVEKIRIDTLRLPPPGKAQRPFHPAKGDQLAADFDIDSFGIPVVCRVEGVNWLVDGQHRFYAIQKCGYAAVTDEIECEVYQHLTMAEMARIFLGRNRTTPVTAFERFGVAVTAGYPAEVAIDRIVSDAGLEIGYPKTDGKVFSVGALRRVYDREGGPVFEKVRLHPFGERDDVDPFGQLVVVFARDVGGRHVHAHRHGDERAVLRLDPFRLRSEVAAVGAFATALDRALIAHRVRPFCGFGWRLSRHSSVQCTESGPARCPGVQLPASTCRRPRGSVASFSFAGAEPFAGSGV